MRLTNPLDQEYIRRLIPDNLGSLIDNLPSLQQGEALLVGDSVPVPSLVMVDEPDPKPASNDIEYLTHWKKEWVEVDFDHMINHKWNK